MKAIQKTVLAGLTVTMLFVLGTRAAEAGSIRLIQGANVLTINDNGAGDADLTVGVIQYVLALAQPDFGVFDTITVAAKTKPADGSPVDPLMSLNVSATSTAAGVLDVLFGDINFGPTGTQLTAAVNASVYPVGSTFMYQTANDPGNALLTGFIVTTQTTNGLSAGALNGGAAAPYSLVQGVRLSHTGVSPPVGNTKLASNISATLSVSGQDVPDGGSTAALLGSALMAFGLLRRRLGRR